MAIIRIQITALVSNLVTRSKGHSAYQSLEPYLAQNQPIEIDLSGDHPLSLSFLDELVWRLSVSTRLDRVTFVLRESTERDTIRKLSRVAEIRDVDVSYLDADTGLKKRVKKLPAPRSELVSAGG